MSEKSRSPKVQPSKTVSLAQAKALLDVVVSGPAKARLLRELLLLLLDRQSCPRERSDNGLGTSAILARVARQFPIEKSLPLVVVPVEMEIAERVFQIAQIRDVLLLHVVDDGLAVGCRDRHRVDAPWDHGRALRARHG
jgi:hypothetical protein